MQQQGQKVDAQQWLDPAELFQVHRRHMELRLQLTEPFLDDRLPLVSPQHLFAGQLMVVGDPEANGCVDESGVTKSLQAPCTTACIAKWSSRTWPRVS